MRKSNRLQNASDSDEPVGGPSSSPPNLAKHNSAKASLAKEAPLGVTKRGRVAEDKSAQGALSQETTKKRDAKLDCKKQAGVSRAVRGDGPPQTAMTRRSGKQAEKHAAQNRLERQKSEQVSSMTRSATLRQQKLLRGGLGLTETNAKKAAER